MPDDEDDKPTRAATPAGRNRMDREHVARAQTSTQRDLAAAVRRIAAPATTQAATAFEDAVTPTEGPRGSTGVPNVVIKDDQTIPVPMVDDPDQARWMHRAHEKIDIVRTRTIRLAEDVGHLAAGQLDLVARVHVLEGLRVECTPSHEFREEVAAALGEIWGDSRKNGMLGNLRAYVDGRLADLHRYVWGQAGRPDDKDKPLVVEARAGRRLVGILAGCIAGLCAGAFATVLYLVSDAGTSRGDMNARMRAVEDLIKERRPYVDGELKELRAMVTEIAAKLDAQGGLRP